MKVRIRAATTVLSAVTVVGAVLVGLAGPAVATTPPFEPDNVNEIGQLRLYDAAGNPVTGGNVSDDPIAKYAIATTDDPAQVDNGATLFGYTPVNGQNAQNWSGEQMSATTAFPVSDPSAPNIVKNAGAHRPVVTLGTTADGNINLAGLIADQPNTNTAGSGWENLYQLRILVSGDEPKYWAADVLVSGSTWTLVYPAAAGKDSSSLTIGGNTTINYGASTTLSTTLTDTTTSATIGGASVKLQKKSGTSWVTVATVNTAASGASKGKASKSVSPTAKTTYRWTYAGNSTHAAATSPTRTVTVNQVVSAQSTKTTVAHNVAFKIYGTVKPASAGQSVTLQRKAGTHWNNIGTATIKNQKLPNGTTTVGFVFTTKQGSAGTYSYRVSKAATATLAAGVSSTLTVHVT